MTSLTVVILTFNEELHIQRCIESVKDIAQQIVVVDSFSTDKTIDIVTSLGAEVVQHEFINQAQQFQWALDTYPIESTWVLRLDADEYLEPELVNEIKNRLSSLPNHVTGVELRLREYYMGRWIRFGGRHSLCILRLFRREKGVMVHSWMDERIVVKDGQVIVFEHDFSNHNLHNTSWWIEKHNNYATREAVEILTKRYNLLFEENNTLSDSFFSKNRIKRFIKVWLYNKLPLFLGPLLYFFYRYFVRLGFLDGKEGAAYHFLQGFWYRFLVEVRVMELDRELKGLPDKKTRIEKLEVMTGYFFE
jgi:glycosyltransferase involved in cell wall biosynthesis